MKYSKVIVLLILIPLGGYFYTSLSRLDKIDFNSEISKKKHSNNNNTKILLVHTEIGLGGAEIHEFNLYKGLIEKGYDVDLLVSKGSDLSKMCENEKVPYYSTNAMNYKILKQLHTYLLTPQIKKICSNGSIVQTYNEKETWAAKNVKKTVPIKIIFTRHFSKPLDDHMVLKDIDGMIVASSYIEEDLKSIDKNIHIQSISPLFDDKKFLSLETQETQKDFFKREFGVNLTGAPVVCMIANMPSDGNKNHQLLLRAVSKLINDVKKPVEVVIAGKGGSGRKKLELLARELKIHKHVHFLGFTKKVAEVLYHSDMNVLPSKKEAFGISLLEGALMKKPLIYSSGNGGDALVVHEKTGLLFKNNDENDLLAQIGRVLEDPSWAKTLGENAYKHAKEHFISEVSLKKFEDFYHQIV